MADKGDLDIKKEVDINPEVQIPYRDNTIYTPSEFLLLRTFIHGEFRHLKYGGQRDKGIIVEYPPEKICSPREWKKIMDAVLKPEIETLEPNFKRNYLMITRFVNKLVDLDNPTAYLGGVGEKAPALREIWNRINIIDDEGEIKTEANLVYVIMHEILERDFWEKTKPGDDEAHDAKMNEKNYFLEDNQKYWNLLDEKIANRRALRAVRRVWPEANWTDLKDTYGEDK